MKRIRAVGILIKNNKVLLIHRKNEKEYWVFPGGGVEEKESIEEAIIRELQEETSIVIKINKLLYHHIYDNNTEQFFYLCDYISGEPRLAEDSPEKIETLEGKDFFDPLWFSIGELKSILLYPLEIRDWFLEDIKDNFNKKRETAYIKFEKRREE